MEWSDEAAIGFNAAGDFFMNHPLGGQLQANAIGCVHVNQNQSLNNVIYDLVSEMVNDTTPPPPRRSLGIIAIIIIPLQLKNLFFSIHKAFPYFLK